MGSFAIDRKSEIESQVGNIRGITKMIHTGVL